MKKFKEVNTPTKKILLGVLGLFMVSVVFFLYLLTKYDVVTDVIWMLFFLYGVVYAGLFWLSIQFAYKIKNLKLGLTLFLGGIIIGFMVLIYFLRLKG